MSWIADSLRNLFGGDRPLTQRLAIAARNYARRFTLRQACCGHPGEPGC
ncbi:MAG TPA: hypothetical protein VFW12_02580 [Candidatus Limnocylindria bacterium]|nr:hypothetical protein [Candidatus Limnocylindria bacterium]